MDLERNRLGLGRRPALILVDMIKGFTDPACPLGYRCPDVVEANSRLLHEFHRLQLPVYFTTVVYHRGDQATVFRRRLEALNVLTPDSEWVHVDARLDRRPGDELIEKQWASGFFQTDLDQRLRNRGVDSLVVTGLTTSGCVRATAVDGLQYNYPVVIPREAVGDRNPQAHAANLFDLHAKYADVMSLEEVLAEIPDPDSAGHGASGVTGS
ncbi:MAG: isochorismatase family protein [Haliea sp.]|jgi:nicotinamidase-related amidase|nr:isochorismatase family protein [Haliea sp.]